MKLSIVQRWKRFKLFSPRNFPLSSRTQLKTDSKRKRGSQPWTNKVIGIERHYIDKKRKLNNVPQIEIYFSCLCVSIGGDLRDEIRVMEEEGAQSFTSIIFPGKSSNFLHRKLQRPPNYVGSESRWLFRLAPFPRAVASRCRGAKKVVADETNREKPFPTARSTANFSTNLNGRNVLTRRQFISARLGANFLRSLAPKLNCMGVDEAECTRPGSETWSGRANHPKT